MTDADVYARFDPFPMITVTGSARTMGYQHGVLARRWIGKTVGLRRRQFLREGGHPWPRVARVAREFEKQLAEYDPELHLELVGIADGSGFTIEDVVAINASSEIAAILHHPGTVLGDDGCTSMACLPPATATDAVYIGRNWDQRLELTRNVILVRGRPAAGPAFLGLTEAGTVMREGLNELGVGVTGNQLMSNHDSGLDLCHLRGAIPSPFARRRALRCASLEEASAALTGAPVAYSLNHVVAHRSGVAVSLEVTPRSVRAINPIDGVLVHTNHFRAAEARADVVDYGPDRFPDTFARLDRVDGDLRALSGRITLRHVQTVFRDRTGAPNSVCAGPTWRTDGAPVGTVASIVMDVVRAVMYVAPFPVDRNPFQRYALRD